MSKGIVVVGAGGHAKVCIEILRAMGETVDFCIASQSGVTQCLGVDILDGDEHIERLRDRGYGRAFVALGSNGLRVKLARHMQALGYTLVNAVSPQAIISPSVHLGVGIAIMAGAVINADTRIEDLAIINTGATVDHDCTVGQGVHIAPQCGLAGTVSVGARTFLGLGSKVIPGITIGSEVIVGAGGVVIGDINDGETAVGVPARVIKYKKV